MKTIILVTMLNAPPDTIPYLQQPYYSDDTLTTNKELRTANHRNSVKLKQAERQSATGFVVGIILGAFVAFGIANTLN